MRMQVALQCAALLRPLCFYELRVKLEGEKCYSSILLENLYSGMHRTPALCCQRSLCRPSFQFQFPAVRRRTSSLIFLASINATIFWSARDDHRARSGNVLAPGSCASASPTRPRMLVFHRLLAFHQVRVTIFLDSGKC